MKSMQIILAGGITATMLLGGCANSSNPAAPTNSSSWPLHLITIF